MGTTATALRTQPGVVCCYVLAIEGYEYLLTSHATMAAVVTAWAGTGWSQVLPGLKVGGPLTQSIKPWQEDLDVPTLQLAVQPDENDTFGKAVFKTKPSFSTRLTGTYRPAVDGSGVVDVKSTSGAASSGDVYIGKQKLTFVSKGGTSFTVDPAGSNAHSPYSADTGGHFAPPVTHAENVNFDVAPSPKVSDVPPTWIGRKVALYVHRVAGGVIDTRAQAQLEFAGKIRGVDDSEDGNTLLDCEDLRAAMRDAVILDNQWTGYVKPGIRLAEGTRFRVWELTSSGVESGEFTVVASGASGADEVDEGIYDVAEFLSLLDAWLAADGAIEGTWSFSVKQSGQGGMRTEITAKFPTGDERRILLFCSSLDNLTFLGFSGSQVTALNFSDGNFWAIEGDSENTLATSIVSDGPPFKVKFGQFGDHGEFKDIWHPTTVTCTLDTSEGSFFDQREYLPPDLRARTAEGESWGIFQVGNRTLLGRYDSATQISGLIQYQGVLKYLDSNDDPANDGLAIDSEEDRLPIRQVVLLTGSFTDIVTKLVASLGGTAGVNHADYDVLPWGAGIPWSLLGDNWLNSAKSLEQALNSNSITTLVVQPTPLLELLMPELALRFAWIVWKDEGYQFRTLPTPNSLAADHVLDETNKAKPAGDDDADKATTHITNEFLRNIIKLEYARDATGKYRRTLLVKEQSSIAQFGGSQTKTIPAVNSFGVESVVSASVQEMAASLVSRVFPAFSKPLKTMRRSIAQTLFHMTPGDTASISDLFARDPTSGVRGIEARAGVVLSASFDRGSEGGKLFGECEILFADEDRHYPMAPAAEIDTSYSGTVDGITFTNGYAATAAGGPAIKLKAHAYSPATASADVTHFAATDELRIVRLDSATVDIWSRTVVTKDEGDSYLVLSADLTSPSYSAVAADRIRVQYREFSACTTAQKLHAFQADDGDGMIEDVAEPNTYGEQQWEAFGAAALTTLPILPTATEHWGEGKPFHAGLLHEVSLFNNNLPSYRTAPSSPMMLKDPAVTNSLIYLPILMFPVYIGPAATAGLVRKLKVAPFLATANVLGTATVRVTSSALPPKSDSIAGALAFQGATQAVTFTSAATAYAEATAQSLIPVRGSGSPMITWITVELKASSASYLAKTYGLSRCFLGPMEPF